MFLYPRSLLPAVKSTGQIDCYHPAEENVLYSVYSSVYPMEGKSRGAYIVISSTKKYKLLLFISSLLEKGNKEGIMKKALTLAFLAILTATSAVATARADAKYPGKCRENAARPATLKWPNLDTIVDPAVDWPVYVGVQQSGQIDASFNCWGQFGLNFGQPPEVPEWPKASFVTPSGSDIEYLFAGAIWIGGVVDEDTLVSIGGDGWYPTTEMWPSGIPAQPTVTKFDYPTGFSMRAGFYDTLTDPRYVISDPFDNRPHIPLNLRIANRSHVWRSEPFKKTVIYDLVITNIGNRFIQDGYLGIYLDCDVFYGPNFYDGFGDDLAGSLRDDGIGYVIDNNGDPEGGAFTAESPTRCLALKFLKTSFAPCDTSFNWWLTDATWLQDMYDFGPRLRGTPDDPFRDFEVSSAIPIGDRNKYYVLRHREWDYDQILTATIGIFDPIWLEPPSLVFDIAGGSDVRILMSIGPFDLQPDSSVRTLFATFTGDSVHVDPGNFEIFFDPFYPEPYLSNLNFSDVLANAALSDYLADSLLDPEYPVIGVQVAHSDQDSTIIEWDPYVFDDVVGYEVYLSEISLDSFPYPGVLPPWLKPDSPVTVVSVGRAPRYVFDSLDPEKAYFVNVANRTPTSVGDHSEAVFVRWTVHSQPPVPEVEFIFSDESGPAVLSWTPPEDIQVDHYNVYRFENQAEADKKYHAFYDESNVVYDTAPKDSFFVEGLWYYYYAMDVFAQVDAGETSFIDNAAASEMVYTITTVDGSGFESAFSVDITFYRKGPRAKDILVMIPEISRHSDFVRYETVAGFYDSILAGYDYDIYNVGDTLHVSQGSPIAPGLVDWHDFMPYKMVIIDDGISESGFLKAYDEETKGITRYILSGGNVCYMGSFSAFTDHSIFDQFEPDYYPVDDQFITRFFGIDSIYYVPLDYYYYNSEPPFVDSLFGFIWAEALAGNAPGVSYDTLRDPFEHGLMLDMLWPRNTAPVVPAFKPNSAGEVTHLYRSRYPATSLIENEPVGMVTRTGSTSTYLFGFHLWYMKHSEARRLIDWIMSDIPTDVNDGERQMRAERFALYQNYPNPFNPNTAISFTLSSRSRVSLDIYNILGQNVRGLINQEMPAGDYKVVWDGKDNSGKSVSTGIYLYRLNAGEFAQTRKMVLLK
jgi:hypothetical protein